MQVAAIGNQRKASVDDVEMTIEDFEVFEIVTSPHH